MQSLQLPPIMNQKKSRLIRQYARATSGFTGNELTQDIKQRKNGYKKSSKSDRALQSKDMQEELKP